MAQRDEASFTAFYEGSVHSLVRQVHAMTGNRCEAQDCVQEAYARAWQRWDVVGTHDAPEAWVRQVAWRLAVSRFRRAVRGAALLRSERPETAPDLGPDHVALVAALRRLPEAQRRALVLHYVADRTVEEIARETGSPSGTVKARLSRGRAALGTLLRDTSEDTTEGAHRA